ncbi:hypothetical protein B0H17DRAFT_1086127 [Mycena rosella]|uniref:Uncharacterized protein n=1 Tax=Mycena rosella TaxID=1033263 RepID=A0AAD7CYQ1_MYCRO|nr:hypothetical protein B0H17DRAFT_1086127 [Mycena rosella]
MAARFDVAATMPGPPPRFPEDIERAINDALLHDARDMCGTMSLVASRFYAWTKPITFRTVVVRRHDDWTKRISNLLLPNAGFIRALAIDLPSPRLSDDELSHIRQLLEASQRVRHLAVGWNVWARFYPECGSLQLESLYLIWDRAHPASPPSLKHLQHPAELKDLTIYAPPDPRNPTPFRPWGELFLPATAHCPNLAYVTYAADRTPVPTVGSLCEDLSNLQGAMFVLVDIPDKFVNEESEDELLKDDKEAYPNFSTAYLCHSSQVLGEWLAKIEGRPSVLEHPPPHAVEGE